MIENPVTTLIESAEETIESSVSAMGEIISSAGTNSASQTHNTTTNQTMPLHTDGSSDDMLSCCMEVTTSTDNVSKMVLLGSGVWSTTSDDNTIVRVFQMPYAFINNNSYPAYGQFRYFRFSRCGFTFRLSVTPSQGSQGALALAFLPAGYRKYINNNGDAWQTFLNLNTLLSLPYVIADVRVASEVALTVPYVNMRNYVDHSESDNRKDGGVLVVWVFSKLQLAANSGNVGWSVFGEMLELDLQCPRVFTQGKKHLKRKAVHPPPRPPVQQHTVIAPGPGAVNLSNSLATRVSESAALVGESTSVDFTSAGSRASYSDLVECCRRWVVVTRQDWNQSTTTGNRIFQMDLTPKDYGQLGLTMQNFEFWRGSFEIRIMVFGSTLTAGRFQISWFPEVTAAAYSLDQCRNAVYMTSDVGAAPSTMVLPFVNQCWRRHTSRTYGRLVMHCVNQLTHNSTAPSTARVVVLIRAGKDFQLFVPRQSLRVLSQGNTTEQMDDDPVCFINYEIEKIPIQSESHSHIKTFFARQVLYRTAPIAENVVEKLPLTTPTRTQMQLLRMFAYWSGEIVITVSNDSQYPIFVSHTYENKDMNSLDDMTMAGCIIVPGGGSKSINFPYYSETPLRSLEGTQNQWSYDSTAPCFGYLYLFCKATTTCSIFFALKDPNLFYQIPIPNTTAESTRTASEWIQNLSICGDVEQNPGPKTIWRKISPPKPEPREYDPEIYMWEKPNLSDWIPDLTIHGDVESNPGPAPYEHTTSKWTPWAISMLREMVHHTNDLEVQVEVKKKKNFFSSYESVTKRVFKKKNNPWPTQPISEYCKIITKTWFTTTINHWFEDKEIGPSSIVNIQIEKNLFGREKVKTFCNGRWMRDLTADGDVEANPGPSNFEVTREGILKKHIHIEKEYRNGNVLVNEDKDIITTPFSRTVYHEIRHLKAGEVVAKCVSISKVNLWRKSSHYKTETFGEKKEFTSVTTYENWFQGQSTVMEVGGWVRDLTIDGDIERNPGPWSPEKPHYMVLGFIGVGKSHVCNQLGKCSEKVFPSHLTPNRLTTQQKTVEFKDCIVTDTAEKPILDDMIDCFLYVVQPGRFTNELFQHIEQLDKQIPNWRSHAIAVLNYRGVDETEMRGFFESDMYHKLEKLFSGRICTIEKIEDMRKYNQISPYFEHFAELVYLDRGLYRHYGVKVGEYVYHLNTQDILESSLNGSARVTESKFSDAKWKFVGEEAYRSALHFTNSGAVQIQFNVDQNCDSWARYMIGSNSATQGQRMKWCLTVAAAAAFIYAGSRMNDQSPGVFSKIITSISGHFFQSLENIVIKTVIRTVCRIICYLILYCHSPNLLNTGVIVALIAMDLTSIEIDPRVKAACESIANGEFAEFCSNVIDLTDDPDYIDLRNSIPRFTNHARTLSQLQRDEIDRQFEEMDEGMGSVPTRHPLHQRGCPCVRCMPARFHIATDKCECRFCLQRFGPLRERNDDGSVKSPMNDQGRPKTFNEWTTAAKNIQWWLEGVVKVLKWIKEKLFPPDIEQQLKELEAQSSEIATLMACADEHICKCRTDKSYVMDKDTKKRHELLVDKISGLLSKELPAQLNHYAAKINSVMTRLQNLSLEPPLHYTHRPEPLGIWIQGEPGSGKSFLANYIVKQICERYGWSAYAHPIGSDHMDGYTDQEVHVFDDLGQNRDEEDLAIMCNLISSVPFIVPKADLTSKGTTYNGRVVIVTTNKTDFSSIKLAESNALQRRFPVVLHVRPNSKYERTDSHQKVRFNAVNATMDGSLLEGKCWDRNVGGPKSLSSYTECWVSLDPDILLKEIFEELDSRDAVSKFMNEGKPKLELDSDEPDEFDKFFPNPNLSKVAKIKRFVMDSVAYVRNFVDKHRTWFIAAGALGTVISLASFFIPMVKKWFKKEEVEEESYYGGRINPIQIKNYRVPLQNQGPVNMRPIVRCMVNLTDESGDTASGLALGGKTVITYGHDRFSKLTYIQDESVDYDLKPPCQIQINNGVMDLCQYEVEMPEQFKNINHKIHAEDYSGDGYLIWKEGKGYSYLPVSNIHPTTEITTADGTTTSHTYTYIARTWKGSCGAVLVGLVDGNPKILGIHIAGNKTMGCAARLYPMFNQGKVEHADRSSELYHQPRRTKLEPSPVHSGHETMAPAVLSNKDPRLEIEVEDITKKAAAKYVGNVWNPPVGVFEVAKAVVIDRLRLVVKPANSMTYEEAVTSDILPIDWQTSPGHKYQGKTKEQLVKDPRFKDDVMDILAGGHTYFTTYLKDELRSKEKVAQGNTRAIEASNFDYVIAWRMVMGNIARQLFNDQDRVTGFAPGINPYTHFDNLMDQVRWNVLAIDFKKFDGSLSPQLMEAAAEVLASFHTNPEMVKMIHRNTIYSYNLVSDEIWFVNGGMCSGSPATTVMNTICNLLVNYTVLISSGIEPSEMYIAAYGDDTIISIDNFHRITIGANREAIGSNYALPDTAELQKKYSEFFGMTVTSATKSDVIQWTTRNNVEFLKRTPTLFPGTQKIVGKLDLQSMMDHIGWTRGNFQEQLNSFYQELVLHGPKIYDLVREKLAAKAPNYNHPTYLASYNIMKPIVMYF